MSRIGMENGMVIEKPGCDLNCEESLEQLISFMSRRQAGHIADTVELAKRLSKCWSNFEGRDQEAMTAKKLLPFETPDGQLKHRVENAYWKPPCLQFEIERHGQTVRGSIYVSVQQWTLNLSEQTAVVETLKCRQVRKPQKSMDVAPIAVEIAASIVEHREDKRLKWNTDGSVTILIGEIVPAFGPKATIEGRRKRFRVAVKEQLSKVSWAETSANRFKSAAALCGRSQRHGEDLGMRP